MILPRLVFIEPDGTRKEVEAFVALTDKGLKIEDINHAMTIKNIRQFEQLMQDLKRIEEELNRAWPHQTRRYR